MDHLARSTVSTLAMILVISRPVAWLLRGLVRMTGRVDTPYWASCRALAGSLALGFAVALVAMFPAGEAIGPLAILLGLIASMAVLFRHLLVGAGGELLGFCQIPGIATLLLVAAVAAVHAFLAITMTLS